MQKLSNRVAAATISCLFVLANGYAGELSDALQPDPAVPQMKALEGYSGKSDLQVTTESMRQIRGDCEGKWILGGRYLEQTISLRTEDQGEVLLVRTLMTYDVKTGQYRQWMFASDGSIRSGDGTWNEAQKMMTWTTTGDGSVLRTVADFSQPGINSWHLVMSQPTGQVELEVRGTNTRTKTDAK